MRLFEDVLEFLGEHLKGNAGTLLKGPNEGTRRSDFTAIKQIKLNIYELKANHMIK